MPPALLRYLTLALPLTGLAVVVGCSTAGPTTSREQAETPFGLHAAEREGADEEDSEEEGSDEEAADEEGANDEGAAKEAADDEAAERLAAQERAVEEGENVWAVPGTAGEHNEAVLPAECVLHDGPRSFADSAGEELRDAACVPRWTAQQLRQGFAAIRDERWLFAEARPDFARRIPWLSALTGCEQRAVTANYQLTRAGLPTPWFMRAWAKRGKTFLVQTANEPDGDVNWSGHVAPVVRVDGELFVLDPALDPRAPLPVQAWLRLFSTVEIRDVALCRDHENGTECLDAAPAPQRDPRQLIADVLDFEWNAQELLGHDPTRSLGACPPWTTCSTPEPAPDPKRPPVITRFATDQFTSDITGVLYIVGDNFIPGVTQVRIRADGVDSFPVIAQINARRIHIDQYFEAGTYEVTLSNGALTSESRSFTSL